MVDLRAFLPCKDSRARDLPLGPALATRRSSGPPHDSHCSKASQVIPMLHLGLRTTAQSET